MTNPGLSGKFIIAGTICLVLWTVRGANRYTVSGSEFEISAPLFAGGDNKW